MTTVAANVSPHLLLVDRLGTPLFIASLYTPYLDFAEPIWFLQPDARHLKKFVLYMAGILRSLQSHGTHFEEMKNNIK